MSVIDDKGGSVFETRDTAVYLKAVGLLVAMVIGGAVIWGLVGYFTEGVYYAVGILIGIGMVRVGAEPFQPLNFIKGALILGAGAVLSLITIAIGEFLVAVIYCKYELGYSLTKSIGVPLDNLVDILSTEAAVIGYTMVLIGAVIGLINAVQAPRG